MFGHAYAETGARRRPPLGIIFAAHDVCRTTGSRPGQSSRSAVFLIESLIQDTSCLLLSERLEGELLATNTRLEHEATLTGGEDRHAVLVFRVRRRAPRSRDRACLSRE